MSEKIINVSELGRQEGGDLRKMSGSVKAFYYAADMPYSFFSELGHSFKRLGQEKYETNVTPIRLWQDDAGDIYQRAEDAKREQIKHLRKGWLSKRFRAASKLADAYEAMIDNAPDYSKKLAAGLLKPI